MPQCLPFQALKGFNPRSREGSDIRVGSIDSPVTRFNPRSREGSDRDIQDIRPDDIAVSIHAPVKGATRTPAICRVAVEQFQSTLP